MNDSGMDPRYDPELLSQAREEVEQRAAECERVLARLRSAYADMQHWGAELVNLHKARAQVHAAIEHVEWHAAFYIEVLAKPNTAYFGNMVCTGKVSTG